MAAEQGRGLDLQARSSQTRCTNKSFNFCLAVSVKSSTQALKIPDTIINCVFVILYLRNDSEQVGGLLNCHYKGAPCDLPQVQRQLGQSPRGPPCPTPLQDRPPLTEWLPCGSGWRLPLPEASLWSSGAPAVRPVRLVWCGPGAHRAAQHCPVSACALQGGGRPKACPKPGSVPSAGCRQLPVLLPRP